MVEETRLDREEGSEDWERKGGEEREEEGRGRKGTRISRKCAL
jgi:hypothetical protein